jgi:hypothetical protein
MLPSRLLSRDSRASFLHWEEPTELTPKPPLLCESFREEICAQREAALQVCTA